MLAVELDDPFLDLSGFWSMLASSAETEIFFGSFGASLLFVLAFAFAPLSSDFFFPIAAAGKNNFETLRLVVN